MKVNPGLDRRHFLLNHLQTVCFGMLQKLVGQFEPTYFKEARVIFDPFGQGHLPPRHALFDEHGLECRPHGINSGGESGWAPANNDQIIEIVLGHHLISFPPVPHKDPLKMRRETWSKLYSDSVSQGIREIFHKIVKPAVRHLPQVSVVLSSLNVHTSLH